MKISLEVQGEVNYSRIVEGTTIINLISLSLSLPPSLPLSTCLSAALDSELYQALTLNLVLKPEK